MDLLMPSGSIAQFERWLGFPGWSREGTSLAPHPAPLPAIIRMADDLAILANIVRHGGAGAIVRGMRAAARPPHSPGWAAALALAPTARDAVQLLATEIPQRNPFLHLAWGSNGRSTRIAITTAVPEPARLLVVLGPLVLIHRHVELLVGGAAGACLALDMEPVADLVPELGRAGLEVRWNDEGNRLSFPREWLSRSNPDGDPVLWAVAKARLQASGLAESPLVVAAAAQIRACLEAERRKPRLADVAAALALSERTLVRRLGADGARFGDLVERERHLLAQLLLGQPGLAVKEVAQRLGYPDAGRFGQAFRAWSGESPARYRRARQGGPEKLA